MNYLTADPQLSGLIKELFHKEEEEASLSVYAAVQQIRTVLEENTYYNKYLSEEDTAGDDLLKEFLQGEREGNSAYYTSAAVLALRSFHIPARYAEGYLLTGKQAEILTETGSAFLLLTVMPGRKYIWMVWDGYR